MYIYFIYFLIVLGFFFFDLSWPSGKGSAEVYWRDLWEDSEEHSDSDRRSWSWKVCSSGVGCSCSSGFWVHSLFYKSVWIQLHIILLLNEDVEFSIIVPATPTSLWRHRVQTTSTPCLSSSLKALMLCSIRWVSSAALLFIVTLLTSHTWYFTPFCRSIWTMKSSSRWIRSLTKPWCGLTSSKSIGRPFRWSERSWASIHKWDADTVLQPLCSCGPQYIHPGDAVKLGQAELLVIDEAAAIPLPLVKNLLGPYLVFMASTINGSVKRTWFEDFV